MVFSERVNNNGLPPANGVDKGVPGVVPHVMLRVVPYAVTQLRLDRTLLARRRQNVLHDELVDMMKMLMAL